MEDSFRMYKTCNFETFVTSIKETGKLTESRHGGRVPPIPGAAVRPTTTFIPRSSQTQTTSQPFSQDPVVGAPKLAGPSGDRRDTTGVTFGGSGQPMDMSRS